MAAPATPRAVDIRTDLVLLLLLTSAVAALNVHWALLNQAPPGGDDNSHLCASLKLLYEVSLLTPAESVSAFLLCPSHYPPLLYQVTVFFFGLVGVGPLAPVLSFIPFVILLSFSMYGIGLGIGSRAVGLVCALAAIASPVVLDHSRAYFIDMPATAMLALSVCALLYSRDFQHRRWSVVFGISMALGVLTRWTHVAFILPLLLIVAGRALWRAHGGRWPAPSTAAVLIVCGALLSATILRAPFTDVRYRDGPGFNWLTWAVCGALVLVVLALLRSLAARRKRERMPPLFNMLEALGLFVLLAWPWYFYNGARVREKLLYQSGVAVDFWQAVRAYTLDVSTMVYMAPWLLACGIVVGLWNRRLRGVTSLLLLSILWNVALSALLPPDSRYLMPAVVFVIPLALAWTAHVIQPGSRGWWPARAAGVLILLMVSLVSVWQASAFEWPGAFTGPLRRETAVGPDGLPLYLGLLPVRPAPPVDGVYPYDAVLGALCAQDAERPLHVAVLESPEDATFFQPRSFIWHGAMLGLDVQLVQSDESIRINRLAEDVSRCRSLLVVYRDPVTGQQLMDMAVAHGWIEKRAKPSARFTFSPSYRVDLFPALRRASSAEASGTSSGG